MSRFSSTSGAAGAVCAAVFAIAGLTSTYACVPSNRVLPEGACEQDSDCPNDDFFCNPAGQCRCSNDDACDASEFCNLSGFCQADLACISDDDCAQSADGGGRIICDTRLPIPPEDTVTLEDNLRSRTAGTCVPINNVVQCLMDSHCPFGFFCSGAQCLPGCRDNGDCPLGDPCIAGQCDPSPGACNEVGYCDFGQTCDPGGLRCATHRDADVLCTRCDPFSFDPGCDQCLIDPTVVPDLCTTDAECAPNRCVKFPCAGDGDCPPGETCEIDFFTGTCSGHCGDFFCGNTECNDTDDPCPRGYSCFVVQVVSNNLCTRGGGECTAPSACSADAPGELTENGSCSCLSDADCPFDPLNGQLECVNPGPGGACIQGQTCAPSPGYKCSDLL